MGTRAAAYCRISEDEQKLGHGVDDQAEDCIYHAEQQGYTLNPADIFTDNDVSGSAVGHALAVRDEYERMMLRVRRGDYDVILSTLANRLHRNTREQHNFLDDARQAGVYIDTVRGGQYRLNTASGRKAFLTEGVEAQHYSERLQEDVKRAMVRNAKRGASHGRISYGWDRSGSKGQHVETLNEVQAAIVRDLADKVIAGRSLTSLVRDLKARNVPAPTSKPWTQSTIRGLLLRERNAGLLVHHGEVIGTGNWPTIYDVATHTQVVAILKDPARRTSTGSKAVHLLTGLARCAVCNSTVWVGKTTTTKTPIYRCSGNGGHVGAIEEAVDRFVVDVIVGRLARPDAVELFVPADRAAGARAAIVEAESLQGRLDEAAEAYGAGEISLRSLKALSATIEPLLADAQARSRVVDDRPVLAALLEAKHVRAAWDGLDLSQRRSVVALLADIRLAAGWPGKAQTFDPASVEIIWK